MPLAKYVDTNLPKVAEIKDTWCFGLPLYDENGAEMTDPSIQLHIDSAIANIERRLGIFLKPTVIMSNPDERGLTEGTDYDKEEPAYDFDAKNYGNWGFLQLKERPVQKLLGMKLVYPNGATIVDFMQSPKWIKLYKSAGQVHLVPYAGDPTILSAMGTGGYAFVTGQINRNMPQMLYVDYVAGYPLGQIPADIRNAVAKQAAIEVLTIAGDAVMQGITSVSTSIDGLSENTSTAVSADATLYSAHINKYQKDIDNLFAEGGEGQGARSSERGFTLGIL